MPIVACGINHKTADIAVREQVAFSVENTPYALQDILTQGAANEAIILSTCNRTELYSVTTELDPLNRWLQHYPQWHKDSTEKHWYFYQDEAAVRHIMRVASGLDSMALGEPQILGQMKKAFTIAQLTGAVGGQLQRLFQNVFAVTKQIRTDTQIGANSISIAYMAATLAKQIFAELTKCCVLLIGAGQTTELLAMHLINSGVRRVVFASRTIAKAQDLAAKFHGHSIGMSDIPLYLQEADIVIAATSSQLPIIGKGMVERALKARKKRRPMFMVDLAVPRDIEPEIAEIEDVYLYNIDDLQKIIQENLKSRQTAAEQAEAMIEIQAKHFMRQVQALSAVDTICAYREKISILKDDELAKALLSLGNGETPAQVLARFANTLTSKILHVPTTKLKQAAFDGQMDLLLSARQLFDL